METTPNEETNVAADAEALAWLDKNDPDTTEDVIPAELVELQREARAQDPEAEDEPDREPAPAPTEEPKESDEEPPKDPKASDELPEGVSADDYTAALEALRRNKWTDEDIKALPKERLLALGGHFAKREEDFAATHAEYRRLKSEASQQTQAAADSERTSVESSAPSAGPPLDAAITKFRETLDLEEGEGGKAIGDFVEAIRSPLLAQAENDRQILGASAQLGVSVARQLARERLLATYPGLKEADGYQSVLSQMEKQNPAAYFEEGSDPITALTSQMNDASAAVFRDQIVEAAVREESTRDRDKGTATAPGRRKAAPPKPADPFAQAQAWLDNYESENGV